jgi:hypothetical protein
MNGVICVVLGQSNLRPNIGAVFSHFGLGGQPSQRVWLPFPSVAQSTLAVLAINPTHCDHDAKDRADGRALSA